MVDDVVAHDVGPELVARIRVVRDEEGRVHSCDQASTAEHGGNMRRTWWEHVENMWRTWWEYEENMVGT